MPRRCSIASGTRCRPATKSCWRCGTRQISRSATPTCRQTRPPGEAGSCSACGCTARSPTRRCSASAGRIADTGLSRARWCRGWSCTGPQSPGQRRAGVIPGRAVCVRASSTPTRRPPTTTTRRSCLTRTSRPHRRVDRGDSQRHAARRASRRTIVRATRAGSGSWRICRRRRVALSVSPARRQRIPGRPQELPRPELHAAQSRGMVAEPGRVLRHGRYAPGGLRRRLPKIDASLAGVDPKELQGKRVELESRLSAAETAGDVVALATAHEQERWSKIQSLEDALAAQTRRRSLDETREKVRLLKGVLAWHLDASYKARLWATRRSLQGPRSGAARDGKALAARSAGARQLPERHRRIRRARRCAQAAHRCSQHATRRRGPCAGRLPRRDRGQRTRGAEGTSRELPGPGALCACDDLRPRRRTREATP